MESLPRGQPATKADLDALEQRLGAQTRTFVLSMMVTLVALAGLAFAALRLT